MADARLVKEILENISRARAVFPYQKFLAGQLGLGDAPAASKRMPDYVKYICPQFTQTDINFQRIPTVDTSNPFIARLIHTPEESMVVIRFRSPRGFDFCYLLSTIANSFMSRANSIVIIEGKLDLAMQLILTPLILQLVERKRRAS